MPNSIISLREVSYAPPGSASPILCDLSLEVARGEILVLLGESGCGKTTTLRLCNALLRPTRGQVLVQGQDTGQADPITLRRGIGYVLQEGGLLPHWSIARNVAAPLLLDDRQAVDASAIGKRVAQALEMVGLDAREFGNRSPSMLSGGQRQRVGVARALIANAPILLMDEPFGALDPITRHALQREFQALARRLDTTVILVTHDVREALLLANRIALLRAGRLETVGTTREFLQSSNSYARAYRETLEPLEPIEAAASQA